MTQPELKYSKGETALFWTLLVFYWLTCPIWKPIQLLFDSDWFPLLIGNLIVIVMAATVGTIAWLILHYCFER